MPDEAMSAFPVPQSGAAKDGIAPCEFAHALLFTGHMIDQSNRAKPRFPARAEGRARRAIYAAIEGVTWTLPGSTVGLAGGASGGDLLFHECCQELGIPTRVLLALAPEEFVSESVAPGGPEWVTRFHRLVDRSLPGRVEVMSGRDGRLESDTHNVWQRANLWMIEEAMRIAQEWALLALWDGQAGDGPGGTEHFIQVAERAGIRVLPAIRMQDVVG